MAFFRHFFTFFKISKIFQNFKNELIFAPFCPFFDDLKKYLEFQDKYLEIFQYRKKIKKYLLINIFFIN